MCEVASHAGLGESTEEACAVFASGRNGNLRNKANTIGQNSAAAGETGWEGAADGRPGRLWGRLQARALGPPLAVNNNPYSLGAC